MYRIIFDKVTKSYSYEREKRIKHDVLNPFQKAKHTQFDAIRNVSFRIKDGETVGFVGPNGSGKTTTLRLIAGITHPTRGNISVTGKVAPLIELGAGFHSEFSGRENMYLNGVILGMTMSEINQKMDAILDFAGGRVKEFIDTPLKKYSLGMKARLGFAIAVQVDPDILLVDESLSVGDQEFQWQCIAKLEEFKKQGKTTIITSHHHAFMKRFCTRLIQF